MELLVKALIRHRKIFYPVIPKELQFAKAIYLNLSEGSEFADLDVKNTEALIARTQEILKIRHAKLAVGKYAENRIIYKNHPQFCESQRSVHLGIDLMVPAETPVSTPLDATIHSFQDNAELGDYGPTIILMHEIENFTFYTLYGHLSRTSLPPLTRGQKIKGGARFASVGDSHENGGWPPHLHFQIIADIGEHEGDFPGVSSVLEQHEFLNLCPNPNYILQLNIS